jgi:hypothetical protein
MMFRSVLLILALASLVLSAGTPGGPPDNGPDCTANKALFPNGCCFDLTPGGGWPSCQQVTTDNPCLVAGTCNGKADVGHSNSKGLCVIEVIAVGGLCRAPAGPCDAPEYCVASAIPGAAPTCPIDTLVGEGVACGTPATQSCDVAEYCTGFVFDFLLIFFIYLVSFCA